MLAAGLVSLCFPLAVGANEAHMRLSELPDKERNAMFAAVLADKCGAVTRTFFQGFDKKRTAYWSVACGKKRAYMISIENDAMGPTKILDSRC